MKFREYQNSAERTNDKKSNERLTSKIKISEVEIGGLLNGCLGLSGEAGEFNDIIKKWIFHEKPLDEEHAKKELGDIYWYLALICTSMGWDMGEIAAMNKAKLEARYPEGFDIEKANNRARDDV